MAEDKQKDGSTKPAQEKNCYVSTQGKERLPDCPEEVKSFSTSRPTAEIEGTDSDSVSYGEPPYAAVEKEGWQRVRIIGHRFVWPPPTYKKRLIMDAEVIEPGPDSGKYTFKSYNAPENGKMWGRRSFYRRDWEMVNGGPPSGIRVTLHPRKFHRKELVGYIVNNEMRREDRKPYCVITKLRWIAPTRTWRDLTEDDF